MAQTLITLDRRDLSSWHKETLIKAILERLAHRFKNIPTEGIIAGQAVASACYEIVGIGQGVMNDLDVFIEKDIGENSFKNIRVRGAKIDFSVSRCSFSDTLSFSAVNKGSYSIHFSAHLDTDQDINIIGCKMLSNKSSLCAKAVIDGFDLNCVEVAIDLKRNEIVWSEAFQNFLYSKKIKVSRCITPMHTALRLLKKAQDLSFAWADLQEELHLLKMARAIGVMLENEEKNYIPTQLFTEGTLRKYDSYLDFITENYAIENIVMQFPNKELGLTQVTLFKLMPLGLSDEDYQRCRAILNCFKFASDSAVDAYMRASGLLFTEFRSMPSQSSVEAYQGFLGLIDADDKDTVMRESTVKAYFEGSNINDENVLCRCLLTVKWLLRRDKHLCSKIVRRDIKNFLKLMIYHTGLFNEYLNHPITELAVVADNVRWLMKHNYNFVIGLFESRSMDVKYFDAISSVHFKSTVAQGITGFMAVAKERSFESLVKGMPQLCKRLHGSGLLVNELTSQWDFLIQGEKEKHCVGGYFDSCQRYENVVLSVEHPQTGARATAMYVVNFLVSEGVKTIKLSQVQFYGKCNSQPQPELYGVLDKHWSEVVEDAQLPESLSKNINWDLALTGDFEDIPF